MKNFFPVYCNTRKNIGNEQKPISSSCIATEFVIPLYFFYWDFWNYVSVIVIIISNNTVLQCYLLWIFVSIRRFQLIVCIGVSTPPHLKSITPSFAKSPLKSSNYPSPFFRRFTHPLPPSKKNIYFMQPPHPSPPKKKNLIFLWTPIILKFFIINLIPSFKSN